MTVLLRYHVEKPLLAKASAVTRSLGTSTAELFRVSVAEIARIGRVPVDLKISEGDALVDVPPRNKIWSWLNDVQMAVGGEERATLRRNNIRTARAAGSHFAVC